MRRDPIPSAVVKSWLGIGTTTEHDAALRGLQERIVDEVHSQTGYWAGERRTFSLIMPGSGSSWLRLPQQPVAVSSVVYWTGSAFAAVPNLTVGALIVDGRRIVWPTGVFGPLAGYRVTYTAGLAVTGTGAAVTFTERLPGDVEQLLLEMIATRWRNRLPQTTADPDAGEVRIKGLSREALRTLRELRGIGAMA